MLATKVPTKLVMELKNQQMCREPDDTKTSRYFRNKNSFSSMFKIDDFSQCAKPMSHSNAQLAVQILLAHSLHQPVVEHQSDQTVKSPANAMTAL